MLSRTTFRRDPAAATRADLRSMKLHRQYGTALLLHHLLRVVERPDARRSSASAATGTPGSPAATERQAA